MNAHVVSRRREARQAYSFPAFCILLHAAPTPQRRVQPGTPTHLGSGRRTTTAQLHPPLPSLLASYTNALPRRGAFRQGSPSQRSIAVALAASLDPARSLGLDMPLPTVGMASPLLHPACVHAARSLPAHSPLPKA